MIWRFGWSRSSKGSARGAKSHCATTPAHPQKIVALQISSSLNWRSIRVDGKAVQFVSQPYISDIDHTGALSEAIVTLPAEIRPKDSVELEIGYEGVIPLDATRLTRVGVPEEIAKHSSWDQIGPSFTAVRGAGYVAWYPITTESADFSEGNSLFEVCRSVEGAGSEERDEGSSLCTELVDSTMPAMITETSAVAKMKANGGGYDDHICRLYAHSNALGTVTPTFAMANYMSSSQSPFDFV